VDPESGAVWDLFAADTAVGGQTMLLCNNSTIGSDGAIWFSDSSSRFPQPLWKADILEHSGTGRLLRRGTDGRVEVVATGLQFANGVALAPDESFVVVAESGGYRLTRMWLTGPKDGQQDVLVELPGFPDNVAVGTDGLLWVAIGSPRNAALDLLSPRHPLWRKVVWALPDAVQPKPADTAWVQAFSFDGTLVHDFQRRIDGFSMVTGVREHEGTVWMGNLHSRAIAAFDVPGTGLSHVP
jgi:sugar lactone lactonase YvrE